MIFIFCILILNLLAIEELIGIDWNDGTDSDGYPIPTLGAVFLGLLLGFILFVLNPLAVVLVYLRWNDWNPTTTLDTSTQTNFPDGNF